MKINGTYRWIPKDENGKPVDKQTIGKGVLIAVAQYYEHF